MNTDVPSAYIPAISADGQLAPGLAASIVRDVLGLGDQSSVKFGELRLYDNANSEWGTISMSDSVYSLLGWDGSPGELVAGGLGAVSIAGQNGQFSSQLTVGGLHVVRGSLGFNANRVLTTSGTGGVTAQSSPVSLDGSGNVTGVAGLTASGQVVVSNGTTTNGSAASPAIRLGTFNSGWYENNSLIFQTHNGAINVVYDSTSLRIPSTGGFTLASGGNPGAQSADVRYGRNGTAQAGIYADNGCAFRNLANNAFAPVQCSNLTASGTVTVANAVNTAQLTNEEFSITTTTTNHAVSNLRFGNNSALARMTLANTLVGSDTLSLEVIGSSVARYGFTGQQQTLAFLGSGGRRRVVLGNTLFFDTAAGVNFASLDTSGNFTASGNVVAPAVSANNGFQNGGLVLNGTHTTLFGSSVRLNQSSFVTWSRVSVAPNGGNADAGMSSPSAGMLEINNGTAGTLRDLSLRNLTASGNLVNQPRPVVSLTNNGQLEVEATSNTQLTFRFRGSDGVTRSASLTLS